MNSKIIYQKEGDYYIPDLYLEKDYIIEKYAHLSILL